MISIKNISKSYNDHQALNGISFEIPSQSIFGLLGPNGAGKTTLLRIINQIIEADEGRIEIGGQPLNSEHIEIIGYLPEERGLYKKMKVSEQLLFLGQLRGMSRTETVHKIKEWTGRLGISDWLSAKVEDLSKGMAQKIQFIGTVLNEPKLIILDEPFSGFDPVNADLIKKEILRMRENGSTILFSTHRMESVEELCDEFTLINKSKVILTGKKNEIKNSFRDHTYIVRTNRELQEQEELFKLIETNSDEDGQFSNVIRINKDSSTSDLLMELAPAYNITAFNERIPSINDIFISLTTAV